MPTSAPLSSGGAFQNSLYVGTNVQNILYGMELILYFKTIYIILSKRRPRRKSDIFYALFSSVMVFSITIWVATQAWIGQEMWLLNPDFPGGADAYWQQHVSDWYMDWGMTGIILLQLMTDGLMIYRCRVVWHSYRVVIIPVILWLATLALGILVDWTSSTPGDDFFNSTFASQFGIAYYTISVFLNTTLTCMICYRILRHGHKVQKKLGREQASLYFTVTTMIVESVLPFTISGIAFVVSYGIGSPTSVAFVSVYILMMCISPQMLILRVIVGSTWEGDTSGKLRPSTIQFGLGSAPDPQRSDGWDTSVHSHTASNVCLPDGHEKV